MALLPSLFISHGAPTLAIDSSPAHHFLLGLGKSLPRPKAILVASAHWESVGGPTLSLAAQPETIHDFGGFSEALYKIRYPAPGAPDLAARAANLLSADGFAVKQIQQRGLDHGAWVPLHLMYPEADIPVTQISLLRSGSPVEHEKMGQALASLRAEGVLIIGSGSFTHNLSELIGHSIDADVPAWVLDFDDWMKEKLDTSQSDALLRYRTEAPFAVLNHPTEEHITPLFVAMGAAGPDARAHRLHSSHEYGVLAMDAYAFT